MKEETMTAQYRKDYKRGWKYSSTANANLDTADRRGWSDNDAWMDGYLDMAAGREMYHIPLCPNHFMNGCGQA